MIIAASTVAFLLFGSIGLYLKNSQSERAGIFITSTFILAFFGSAFMLANEWHQIFVLPEIATINTEVVNNLGSSETFGRYAIGAMLAFSTFSLGWILFSIALLIGRKMKRTGPIIVLSGFFPTSPDYCHFNSCNRWRKWRHHTGNWILYDGSGTHKKYQQLGVSFHYIDYNKT